MFGILALFYYPSPYCAKWDDRKNFLFVHFQHTNDVNKNERAFKDEEEKIFKLPKDIKEEAFGVLRFYDDFSSWVWVNP